MKKHLVVVCDKIICQKEDMLQLRMKEIREAPLRQSESLKDEKLTKAKIQLFVRLCKLLSFIEQVALAMHEIDEA